MVSKCEDSGIRVRRSGKVESEGVDWGREVMGEVKVNGVMKVRVGDVDMVI